ncbi:MAG: polysaccharide pyruvyl transferase family protein [Alphaproteobacteria bacterium]
MDIFYYAAREGNFGDDLNQWLWASLWPEITSPAHGPALLVGIGTILGKKIPEKAEAWPKYVLGSGVGYDPLPHYDSSWHFLAVRGPISAKLLGLKPEVAITDSALLLRALPQYQKEPKTRSGVVFMPHLSAAEAGRWAEVCAQAGITYLDPRWDSKVLLEKIQSAELVLADAMHAAICADVLRTPWIPLCTSHEISTFKWKDWTLSLNVPYHPTDLPPSCVAEALRNMLYPFFHTPARLPAAQVAQWNDEEALKVLCEHHHLLHVQKKSGIVSYTLLRGFGFSIRRLRQIFFPFIDSWLIQRAAKKLRACAALPPVLSTTKRQNQALNDLKKAFERMKTAVRKTSNS